MKLATRFNLILIVVLAIGLTITAYFSWQILQTNARNEIRDRASIMMEAALSMRSYTVNEVRPLLKLQNKRKFLPQTVPAYAATQSFETIRKRFPEYSYKEATLNPTNPRNRAVSWETDIVNEFRKNKDKKEIFGERSTPNGPSLYFARPITITKGACLSCHSTIEAAPKSMVELYGPANGFGWKLNETVGAQIISVPMTVPIKHAREAFNIFMITLGAVFLALIIVLNILLRIIVAEPVRRMSKIADDISLGNMDAAEFDVKGGDEISKLGASFNRMRRSLEQAMKMLED